MQSCTTLRTGLRNSSIGVPMVMMTGPPVEITIGRGGKHQPLGRKRLGQHAFRAALDERQPPGGKRVQALSIEIVDVDAQARFGQRQHQRNADMAGAADHGDVGVLDRGRRLGRRDGGADGHGGTIK